MNLVYVGLGGFLGSVARYLIHLWLPRESGSFPISTLLVNVLGSLAIGLLYGFGQNKIEDELRLFATVGFCGGFTTFSSFALENLKALESANYILFILYTASSLVLCMGSVFLGAYLAK
ncbi:fluoride efflux transporter CrcB [Leptospira langatensis]|uniref:Fluoride-specific ion channel FluC n=1 Tax=Leptospira langatensis TaxID=2484983 RepID=A0A5F1ZTC5_9LEPT|nr:fluoride efflux transporter CrcB [Leptospira langatensis]TGK02701.1 fluoride efflux transporter CrcB [Leptospira langatensis]TGL40096.1 fluoride efflux transporter CrcB [Leptospira langatensis]